MADPEKVGNRRTVLLIFLLSAVPSFISLVIIIPFAHAVVGSVASGLGMLLLMLIGHVLHRPEKQPTGATCADVPARLEERGRGSRWWIRERWSPTRWTGSRRRGGPRSGG